MQAAVKDNSQTNIIKTPISSSYTLEYVNDIENLKWKNYECDEELTPIEIVILTKYYESQLKEAIRLHRDSEETQYRFRHLDQIGEVLTKRYGIEVSHY